MDLTRGEASASRDSHDSREASTAAPRDEARDLWERFGQVAPPPPGKLVVVNRPEPLRRHDGSKSVSLHPFMKVCRYFTPEPASWMVW